MKLINRVQQDKKELDIKFASWQVVKQDQVCPIYNVNSNLNTLNIELGGNNVKDHQDIMTMVNNIKFYTCLHTLNFNVGYFNPLKEGGIKELIKGISSLSNLKNLSLCFDVNTLQFTQLTDIDVMDLKENGRKMSLLDSLSLKIMRNRVESNQFRVITEILATQTQLKCLKIEVESNDIKQENIDNVIQWISLCKDMNELSFSLSNNFSTFRCILQLWRAIYGLLNIQSLKIDIQNCRVKEDQLELQMNNLPLLQSLKTLSLTFSNNSQFNNQNAVSQLLSGLKNLSEVEDFSLSLGINNHVGSKGLEILAQSMKKMQQLIHVSLSIGKNNQIQSDTLKQLLLSINILQQFPSLKLNFDEKKNQLYYLSQIYKVDINLEKDSWSDTQLSEGIHCAVKNLNGLKKIQILINQSNQCFKTSGLEFNSNLQEIELSFNAKKQFYDYATQIFTNTEYNSLKCFNLRINECDQIENDIVFKFQESFSNVQTLTKVKYYFDDKIPLNYPKLITHLAKVAKQQDSKIEVQFKIIGNQDNECLSMAFYSLIESLNSKTNLLFQLDQNRDCFILKNQNVNIFIKYNTARLNCLLPGIIFGLVELNMLTSFTLNVKSNDIEILCKRTHKKQQQQIATIPQQMFDLQRALYNTNFSSGQLLECLKQVDFLRINSFQFRSNYTLKIQNETLNNLKELNIDFNISYNQVCEIFPQLNSVERLRFKCNLDQVDIVPALYLFFEIPNLKSLTLYLNIQKQQQSKFNAYLHELAKMEKNKISFFNLLECKRYEDEFKKIFNRILPRLVKFN